MRKKVVDINSAKAAVINNGYVKQKIKRKKGIELLLFITNPTDKSNLETLGNIIKLLLFSSTKHLNVQRFILIYRRGNVFHHL